MSLELWETLEFLITRWAEQTSTSGSCCHSHPPCPTEHPREQSFTPMISFLSGSKETHGFRGGLDGKVSACNVGDPDLIPESGRSPGEGNGKEIFQYSCLENPMDRGSW